MLYFLSYMFMHSLMIVKTETCTCSLLLYNEYVVVIH